MEAVLLLSGPSATTARLFSLLSGHLVWEQTLHEIGTARLTTPVHLGTDATFTSDGDVVILSDGRRVSKLDGKTGVVSWSLDAPGAGYVSQFEPADSRSTILFKQLHVTGKSVHVLALTSSFATQTLTTLTLSLDNSVPLNDLMSISSSVRAPSDVVIAASANEGEAKIVWHESGRIRSVLLKADGTLSTSHDLKPKSGRYAKLLNVGSRPWGFVLAQLEDGSVDVIDVRKVPTVLESFEHSVSTQRHQYADKGGPPRQVAFGLFCYSVKQRCSLQQGVLVFHHEGRSKQGTS
jgi:hypothetical protein